MPLFNHLEVKPFICLLVPSFFRLIIPSLFFLCSAEQNQEVDEPVTHDYNVLEKPEQTCSEMDEDNNKVSKPLTTEEDPEVLPEPSGFVNIEENPAYAVPWKKNDSEAPARKRSYSM